MCVLQEKEIMPFKKSSLLNQTLQDIGWVFKHWDVQKQINCGVRNRENKG